MWSIYSDMAVKQYFKATHACVEEAEHGFARRYNAGFME
jgi:hypothetical protein